MKILRRQKIYTETIYNFKKVESAFEDKFETNRSNNTYNFFTYVDKYFMHNESLHSFSLDLNKFVQNDRNILLSEVPLKFNEYYVPFYYRKSNKLAPGILLDLPKIVVLEKLCSDFVGYNPMFSSLPKEHQHAWDTFNFLQARIPLVKKIQRVQLSNLNEIVPFVDEINLINDDVESVEESNINSQLLHGQVIILDPVRLELDTMARQETQRLKQSEHNKLARITIMYTLAFFALALITFFIIYLA